MASEPTGKGDELARTTTEAASSAVGPAEPLGPAVGRYRLEREIGAGGMGVVHAAFDPDLERRIALKVLRLAAAGTEAKDRLLREARAMARLSHPNVVTVHEVGTMRGRDYIAMELIEGETLADWLRSEKRQPVDIVAAFLAAGRGLAAAHAAGIVHRDFKPHNVLRNRDGRIVVTDFGLARESQPDMPIELDATLPLTTRTTGTGTSTPSVLSGITVTGSLLGTPAYMAPEQWAGGAVTPATDQFAFCVALWEALAGQRPYVGPTLDDLRKQAALGPRALDARQIPRRLRAILRRGLDPDPARRWSSMDSLLGRMVRAERRPGVALAVAGAAALAAAGLVMVLHARGGPAVPACEPPALEPAKVWGPDAHAGVGAQTAAARLIDNDVASWQTARAAACQAPVAQRGPRLGCLDGVMARIAAVVHGVQAHRDGPAVDAGSLLIDPKVCEQPRAPRLMMAVSEQFREVSASWLARTATSVPLTPREVSLLVARVSADPCAAALAHVMASEIQTGAPERNRQLDEAQQAADRCGDDRILAQTAIASAGNAMGNEFLSSTVTAKLRSAETAIARVPQADLTAEIDLLRVQIARRAENLDDAIARGNTAMRGFAARGRLQAQLRAGLRALMLRWYRATPTDLVEIPAAFEDWRKRAVVELGESAEIVRAIDSQAALWTYSRGEVASAHATFDRIAVSIPNERSQRIAGVVVDTAGKPIAGATVSADFILQGDAVSATVRFPQHESMRTARTGPDGRFEIPDAIEGATVIAERGDLRARPMLAGRDLRLVLAPTSRLEGHVDLAGTEPSAVTAFVRDASYPTARYVVIAPVAHDGSFELAGVPRGKVRVFAQVDGLHSRVMGGSDVAINAPVVRGATVSLVRSKRVLHVLVRSTVDAPLGNAQVCVLAGKVASTNALAVNEQFRGGSIQLARHLEGEHAPPQVIGAARPGDLFATMTEVPDTNASACALAMPSMSDEDSLIKMGSHLDKVPVICRPIPDRAELVIVEVPPMPRLD